MHPEKRSEVGSRLRRRLHFARWFLLGWAAWMRLAGADPVHFTVTPVDAGEQLVRTSLPFPAGSLNPESGIQLRDPAGAMLPAALRVLSVHPIAEDVPISVRRGLVTFPYRFANTQPVEFTVVPGAVPEAVSKPFPVTCDWLGRNLRLRWNQGTTVQLALVAPDRSESSEGRREVVEETPFFRWYRFHFGDTAWPRVVEIRLDFQGTAVVSAQLQRTQTNGVFAPDLGWDMEIEGSPAFEPDTGVYVSSGTGRRHGFANGSPARIRLGREWVGESPDAAGQRRGWLELDSTADGKALCRYRRCLASESVPMQLHSWRRADFVFRRPDVSALTSGLASPHRVEVDSRYWTGLYGMPPAPGTLTPELQALLNYHRLAVIRSAAIGDDLGNLTSFGDGQDHGGAFGMNRLNHGAAIFEDAWRSGDPRLRATAVQWCDNFHDLSIWWGPKETGGTRYNNIVAMDRIPPSREFMWRSDSSVNFCTKGYDCFWLAWEETGDPRMKEALEAQVEYATRFLHANVECRNIGDVRDFIRLYEFTGDRRHLANALRLFRELRAKLSTGNLFDQGGKPIDPQPPYINDDQVGLKVGYAKPYILGYALNGLPSLLRYAPDEPELTSTIRAVADFLSGCVDPAGGWRYPHPNSTDTLVSQGIEHAWQLTQAARVLGPEKNWLDAVETVLRARILTWKRSGRILSGLGGWEVATGEAKSAKEVASRYQRAGDRDPGRDYSEGAIGLGSAPPEGLVYFSEVLAFYLQHRPVERLLVEPAPESPLGRLLARLEPDWQSAGVRSNLPVFHERLASRLTFPLAWDPKRFTNFSEWRGLARSKVTEHLLTPPPPAAFTPRVVAEQDRGSYVARKVSFQLTADSRVLALVLIPKSAGPHPAVLLLHDHGARFDIGKEKLIEPWDETPAKMTSAREWVDRYYGGRFVGDELARRGYVCLATDMLNWSDRGGGGYDRQQALAANLFQFGMSWAGLIAHEDLRAAEFLAGVESVDPKRVAALGLSVGGFRTWQLAALSDRIAAGVSVCWMATHRGLMVPGNNQTTGQSAFSMVHPGLAAFLDYPDVAAIACPKPMFFQSGRRDALFPTASIEAAYATLRRVWQSQGAGEKLETRLYDAPHEFNRTMQDEAFDWLDRNLVP